MSSPYLESLRTLRIGLLLALLAVVYGFGLGAAFGAAEDDIKAHLRADADAVFDAEYGGDEARRDKVTAKAWTYFKRAHLHANGLGTAALAMILVLAALPAGVRLRSATAIALGLGAIGYSLFWMFAGLAAPGLGSTGAAKASLEWLAIPSSGLCIIGLLLTLRGVLAAFFLSRQP